MAKRISDIAKELGIQSKMIIEKCLAEGIPSDKVKGHMSTVSAGLEASIREWFASGSSVATAVENTEHPDVAKMKAPVRKRTGKPGGRPGDDSPAGVEADQMVDAPGSGTPTTADEASHAAIRHPAMARADHPTGDQSKVVEPKSEATTAHQTIEAIAHKPTATESGHPTSHSTGHATMQPVPHTIAPATGTGAASAPTTTTSPAPHTSGPTQYGGHGGYGAHSTPAKAATPPPATPPAKPAVVHRSPPPFYTIKPQYDQPAQVDQTRRPAGKHDTAPVVPPPRVTPVTPVSPLSTDEPPPYSPGTATAIPHSPPEPPKVIRPAPMNVPTRPTVVTPAGKKLEIKTPVKLSGPKVVRIEAPEVVNVPRPRRDGPSDGPGRTGPTTGGTDDEAGRSPRRKKRPTPGAAPVPGAAGAGVPARRKGRSDEPAGGMWREQDLLEREARLLRAGGFLKKRRHELKLRTAGSGDRLQTAAVTGGVVRIPAPFTLKDISAATGVKVSELVKKLFLQGIMATANSGIDPAKAQEIMIDFNIELEVVESKTAEEIVSSGFVDRKPVDIRSRGPVVTILGHVDHGKTSLLDNIRKANVAAGEAGGITQATSAFRVPVTINGETKNIVFLDTPGHKAFTEMRARGASITDVVVLVVSGPEGVAPQTIESINHAKAAKVPIVVALNKMDRPDATEGKINQTLSQLAEQGLNPIEWGGTTEVVRTSATKGTGIDQLLEILDLQGQMLELKADFGGLARGTVIEAKMEEGRGAVANVLVQDGLLNVGDFIVLGRAYGKVRDIVDDRGVRHKSVGPGNPVQVSGFDMLPDAGDKFFIVDSLRKATEAAEQRRDRERHDALATPKVTLDTLFSQMTTSVTKEILTVLKADVQGSVDVLRSEIESIKTDEVKARVIHAAVGGINESDVLLADASKAIIVGFNVIASGKARSLAESKGVEIRTYQVIYDLTDDIRLAAEGLLTPETKQEVLGHADVRKVFKVTKVGTIAGCYITDGVVERDALIRVTRNGIIIENGRKLEQLKRVKDDAKEVRAGMECGMKIAGYDDVREGDVLECYKQIEVKRKL